ncbi:MAG: gliding motility-associated ABC transporter permease subunit GldF [Bacteroidales bacterium]|nr:gliding motility-associated ABC transporter permease subunit GldF [Bacteroidales bacterium]
MRSLYLKEISGFFSSITGYIVVGVFLIVNGLFLWVFPGNMNVLDAGYASLDTLFFIAPWVFLFLIPAITMRSFAEEKKSGNLDLLLTRPLSELQIVMAKYLAGITVAAIALIPTLVFYVSLVILGNPTGNIDAGGTLGSYLGLFLLAGIYVSIGVFASSLTENTIVAFVLSVALCFFLYEGFNSVGYLSLTGKTGNFILNLGIDAHYKSMQRGVLDSRDLIYFLSVIVLFLLFTRTKLRSINW